MSQIEDDDLREKTYDQVLMNAMTGLETSRKELQGTRVKADGTLDSESQGKPSEVAELLKLVHDQADEDSISKKQGGGSEPTVSLAESTDDVSKAAAAWASSTGVASLPNTAVPAPIIPSNDNKNSQSIIQVAQSQSDGNNVLRSYPASEIDAADLRNIGAPAVRALMQGEGMDPNRAYGMGVGGGGGGGLSGDLDGGESFETDESMRQMGLLSRDLR